jgi:hypothetical protein
LGEGLTLGRQSGYAELENIIRSYARDHGKRLSDADAERVIENTALTLARLFITGRKPLLAVGAAFLLDVMKKEFFVHRQ